VSPARRIFLIRHGETPSNAARIFQTPDTPLSERGRVQARSLAERLRAEPVAQVIASDYERAVETGRAVADALAAPLQLDPLLRERNFGDLRGRPYAEIKGDPFREGYAPPNGESWDQFHARVGRAWTAVLRAVERCDGDLAVVTHGLVCRAFVEQRLDAAKVLAGANADVMAFANTSVTIAAASAPWHVERLACTEHLTGGHPDVAPA
jgi:broad specificity phosphatase PhoE